MCSSTDDISPLVSSSYDTAVAQPAESGFPVAFPSSVSSFWSSCLRGALAPSRGSEPPPPLGSAPGGASSGYPSLDSSDFTVASLRRRLPCLPFEIGHFLGLEVGLLTGAVALLLGLALALLLAAAAAQGGVVGQVAGRLLDSSADLVGDAHVVGLPGSEGGGHLVRAEGEEADGDQPAWSATVRSRSS